MLRTLTATLLALLTLVTTGAAAPAPAAPAPKRLAAIEPAAEALARDTLAIAGERAVTALDLVQRIEWMPWLEKRGAASMDSARVHALESLVAEALLAQASARVAPADAGETRGAYAALRRALARDALFREMCDAEPAPAPAEVARIARRLHPHALPAELARARLAVADSLRQLVGRAHAARFMVDVLAGHSVRVDSALFQPVADSLRVLVERGGRPLAQGQGWIMPGEAPDVLAHQFAGQLDHELARLPDGPLTLGEVLDDLAFYLFAFHSLERRAFAIEWNQRLKAVVEGEILAREAIRRGLDRRADVQRDLRLWADAWLARVQVRRVLEAAPPDPDAAFRRYALTHPQESRAACDVDVDEILTSTREEGEALRARVLAGAPFDSLARAHTQRLEWAPRGGRSGWFPVPSHPELGAMALLSPTDSLLGPGRLPEGWTLYRVRGKRLARPSAGDRDALDAARGEAEAESRVRRIAGAVAALADSTTVRMDLRALRRVPILPSNMAVRRRLGYGGGMMAAPSLLPMWQWMPLWRGRVPAP